MKKLFNLIGEIPLPIAMNKNSLHKIHTIINKSEKGGKCHILFLQREKEEVTED